MRKDLKSFLARLPWGITSARVAVKMGTGPMETIGTVDIDEPPQEPGDEEKPPAPPQRDVEALAEEIQALLLHGADDPDVIKITVYSGNKVVQTLQETKPKEDKAGSSDAMSILARALSNMADANVRMVDAGSKALSAQGEAFNGALERMFNAQDQREVAVEEAQTAKLEAAIAEIQAVIDAGGEEPGLFDKVSSFLDGILTKAGQKGPDLDTPEGLSAWVTLHGAKLKPHLNDPRVQEAFAHLWPTDPPTENPDPGDKS